MKKRAFSHVDGAGGIGTKCADRVMGIVIIEPTQHRLNDINLVITINIPKQHQMSAMCDVDSFGGELKSRGHMQTIGKDRFLVCFPVLIGVF